MGDGFELESVTNWLEARFDFDEQAKLSNSHKVATWDFLSKLAEIGILNKHPNQYFEVVQDDLKTITAQQKRINNYKKNPSVPVKWSTEWPDIQDTLLVAKRFNARYGSVLGWDTIARLLITARDKHVPEILFHYADDEEKRKLVMQFFVEVGFLDF